MSETVAPNPHRLALGVRPDGEMTRTGVGFAFVLGTIAVFAFLLGIVGIVLSNMGMNRARTNPELARKLITWSWVYFAVLDTLFVLLIVTLVLAG